MTISLRDIAKKAGVSVGTASNVLNRPGIVSPETAKRVQQVIEEMGYNPNGYVKQMSAGHSRTLGLVVPNVSNPFFAEVARGVEDAAAKKNYAVFICNTGEMIDAAGKTSTECSVSVNDVRGGEIAIEHLASLNHTSIAWVCGPATIPQAADRSKGVAAAAKSLKLKISPITTGTMTFAAGEEAVEEFLALESRPTAIFCANDLLALGMMRGLIARGVRIPEEVSIIGYDDIEFAPSAAVPLTSIAQPAYQLGTVAAQLLLSECEGIETHAHQEVHFQPELVVRNSTRDVASARAEAVVRREYAHLATSYFGSSAPA